MPYTSHVWAKPTVTSLPRANQYLHCVLRNYSNSRSPRCLWMTRIWAINVSFLSGGWKLTVYFGRYVNPSSLVKIHCQTPSLSSKKKIKMHVDTSYHTISIITMKKKSVPFSRLWRHFWQVEFKSKDLKICLFYWWRTFAFFFFSLKGIGLFSWLIPRWYFLF